MYLFTKQLTLRIVQRHLVQETIHNLFDFFSGNAYIKFLSMKLFLEPWNQSTMFFYIQKKSMSLRLYLRHRNQRAIYLSTDIKFRFHTQ